MKWRAPIDYDFRVALLAYVLIPVISVVFVVGAWSLRVLENQVNARMQQDIELVARAIRLPLSHALEEGSIGSIYQALRAAFNIDVVYGAYVYDENGVEVASSGPSGATIATEDAARVAATGADGGSFQRAGEETVFSYFIPLTDSGGRISGLLQVTRRGSDFIDYIDMVRRVALLAFVITCIVLTALVLFGHHGAIGRHFRRLMSDMTRIQASPSDRRLGDDAPAEMRVLSKGINRMLDRINASQQELEQRRLQETELRLRLQYSEKLAAIGQLASGIAHELGSPLSTVDGKAQQALRRTSNDPAMQDTLREIRAETARMERIIQQLLDFGRRNPLQRVHIDCSAAVATALQKLGAEIEQKGVRVELPASERKSPPDAEDEHVWLYIDLVRFEQALGNLLANAVQASRHVVRVDWFQNGEAVIEISDDGPGISAGELSRIFDPFYTTKPVGEGTGLGLAVAQAAVADHQGRIEAGRSSLGGATFRIILPKSDGSQPTSGKNEPEPVSAADRGWKSHETS